MNEWQGAKVMVTGGAGFIGSHLCDRLTGYGANVVCVDNLSAGKLDNIQHLFRAANFEFIEKDITDKSGWNPIFKDLKVIFNNAASKKNICLIDPHKDLLVNGGGTLNLLEQARKFNVEKFVHASTGSVYGEPFIFPTTEDHPLAPVSYYGVSKLAGERYVAAFNHLYGLNTTILRYFHVYGPRQESNEFGGVVTIFMRNIKEGKPLVVFGDGNQERSFTYVDDIVEANVRVASSVNSVGKVYNVASGIKISINQLADFLASQAKGKKVDIKHGPPLLGDIYKFDVSNDNLVLDTGIFFNKDFWGTLEKSLFEFQKYL